MTRMTIDQFLVALRSLPPEYRRTTDWEYADRLRFRTPTGHYCCPITVVAHHVLGAEFRVDQWKDAGQALGLFHDDARLIVHAADSTYDHSHSLRAALYGVDKMRAPLPWYKRWWLAFISWIS